MLKEIVSKSIMDMIDYVLHNQKSFIQDLMELSKKDMDTETERKKKLFQKNELRISKIDDIVLLKCRLNLKANNQNSKKKTNY